MIWLNVYFYVNSPKIIFLFYVIFPTEEEKIRKLHSLHTFVLKGAEWLWAPNAPHAPQFWNSGRELVFTLYIIIFVNTKENISLKTFFSHFSQKGPQKGPDCYTFIAFSKGTYSTLVAIYHMVIWPYFGHITSYSYGYMLFNIGVFGKSHTNAVFASIS